MRKLLVALLFLSFGAFADDKAPAQSSSVQVQAAPKSDLQNDKHYVNRDGQVVHSPTKTNSGQTPASATAKCSDGTFSFSKL